VHLLVFICEVLIVSPETAKPITAATTNNTLSTHSYVISTIAVNIKHIEEYVINPEASPTRRISHEGYRMSLFRSLLIRKEDRGRLHIVILSV